MKALHYAALCGNDEIVRILMEYVSVCNDVDLLGETALIKASQNGQAAVAKALLEGGADPLVRGGELFDVDIRTPPRTQLRPRTLKPMAVHHAASNGHENLLTILTHSHMTCGDREVNALHLGAMYGYTSVVQNLLLRGANVESTDNMGITALHYASYNGHNAVLQLLFSRGCEINSSAGVGNTAGYTTLPLGGYTTLPLAGYTALHFAAQTAKVETIRLLVTHGAAIDKKDIQGGTSLHVAAQSADAETIRALVECGAALEKQDRWGRTALETVIGRDQPANALALTELGAEWIRNGVFVAAVLSNGHNIVQILSSAFSTATAEQQRDAAVMAKRVMNEHARDENNEVVRLFKTWLERQPGLS